ncbi:expressed unknown protein [Seminavis robusta]|uniref:Uncharacterized protein n=1 Tax=Seminavis robusta TaxID=568900 RepID=A0A9N8H7A6_9STRA|nr:expressed unknown protein [Seminavis robusta]|eukprot:Sro64_g036260.1 n/a (767) ;mRNA; r:55047-57347
MTSRIQRRNGRRSAPVLLVDYSKQRAKTDDRLSKSLHIGKTPVATNDRPKPVETDVAPVSCLSKCSKSEHHGLSSYQSMYTKSSAKDEDLPGLSSFNKPQQPEPPRRESQLSQTLHSVGTRQWEIDEALLDFSTQSFDDSDSTSENEGTEESSEETGTSKSTSTGKGSLLDAMTTSMSGSSCASSSAESSDSDLDTSGSQSSDDSESSEESSSEEDSESSESDVPDDISELSDFSDDDSLCSFACMEHHQDSKDLKGEMSVADSLTASLTTHTPSFTENHCSGSTCQSASQSVCTRSASESVCFALRRRTQAEEDSKPKEVVPSAIRLEQALTKLLGDGSCETNATLDAALAPEVDQTVTVTVPQARESLKRRNSSRSLGYLIPKDDTRGSIFKRSNSLRSMPGGLIPSTVAQKPASKRNPLAPAINAMSLPRIVAAEPEPEPVDPRKANRRSIRRSQSSTGAKMIVINPDGTPSRSGLARTDSCSSLGELMNDASARILIEGGCKAAAGSSDKSVSGRGVMGNSSGRRLVRGDSGRSVIMNSGRGLSRGNSNRSLMTNHSGKSLGVRSLGAGGSALMTNNSGRSLGARSLGNGVMSNNSGRSLGPGNRTNDKRRARRRLTRSKSSEGDTLDGPTQHPRSNPQRAVLRRTQSNEEGHNRSSRSLGSALDSSERSAVDHTRVKRSNSSGSLNKLMGLENLNGNGNNRRASRRASMDSVSSRESAGSADTARSNLTSLRNFLARGNPGANAGTGTEQLFVTGSRIRRR